MTTDPGLQEILETLSKEGCHPVLIHRAPGIWMVSVDPEKYDYHVNDSPLGAMLSAMREYERRDH